MQNNFEFERGAKRRRFMMDAPWLWICSILCLLGFDGVSGQCDNSTMVIREGHDSIIGPNQKNTEYGHAENCSWELRTPSDGQDYALLLKISWLALYIEKNGRRHCLGSYNLTINDEQIECGRLSTGSKYSYTTAYLSSTMCSNNTDVKTSETQEIRSEPVGITYVSDGRTDASVPHATLGFNIVYKFIDCSTGLAESEICDASGRKMQNKTTGTIQAHKGVKNCSWEFSPPSDGKKYAIKYHVDFLDLNCNSSLIVNNKLFSCSRKVRFIRERFCLAYFSSANCKTLASIENCEIRNETSYPSDIRYSSTQSSYGFTIRYEFLECREDEPQTSDWTFYIVLGVVIVLYVLSIAICAPAAVIYRRRWQREKRSKPQEEITPMYKSTRQEETPLQA